MLCCFTNIAKKKLCDRLKINVHHLHEYPVTKTSTESLQNKLEKFIEKKTMSVE